MMGRQEDIQRVVSKTGIDLLTCLIFLSVRARYCLDIIQTGEMGLVQFIGNGCAEIGFISLNMNRKQPIIW